MPLPRIFNTLNKPCASTVGGGNEHTWLCCAKHYRPQDDAHWGDCQSDLILYERNAAINPTRLRRTHYTHTLEAEEVAPIRWIPSSSRLTVPASRHRNEVVCFRRSLTKCALFPCPIFYSATTQNDGRIALYLQ